MDNHAVPREITSFEFKLLGWFTVKQGIYLAVFAGAAVVTYFIIPVPILNFLMAFCVGLFGAILVFYRHNDRSMDVWIRNLITSLLRPSQFFFHKDNDAPAFLRGVFILNEAQAQIHLDATQKLTQYMAQTGQRQVASTQKQNINTLIHTTPANAQAQEVTSPTASSPSQPPVAQEQSDINLTDSRGSPNKPFLSGIVRNSKEEALPNIMVYVNTDAGQLLRILKTNHNGVFATFHQLPTGGFIISPKDLSGTYFFDTMSISVDGVQKEPLQIYSKELL